ncbi:MAG: hypothetical protein HEP71_03465 [Roseivirga sp.]|nr:hypothetical protein [Roseivirga sp.]
MLNFLRKLRRPPAGGRKEMQSTKYLKYALGEIFLVVIGILIALSINNLNTGRQQQKELLGYLEKIARNMEQDLALAEEYLIKRDSSQQMCIQALNTLKKGEVDMMVFAATSSVFVEFYFIANKSGFEALKASGYIGKLKNEKLDSLLNQYYFTMTQLEQEETSYNNFIESMEAQWMGNYSITALLEGFDITTGQIVDFEAFNNAILKNKDKILTEPVEAVVLRGATELAPQGFYRQLIATGGAFIEEVERMK